MIILPAIDIKDGNCVRLFKGDYATVQKVAESPYIAAQGFADAGAERMLQKPRDFLLRLAEESVI